MATFTESFNKVDGAGLGPDLTWTDPETGWATATNQGVIGAVTATEIEARAEADTGSADMYVQLVLPDFGDASYGDIGLCVRMSADRQTRYTLKRTTTGDYEIRKYVSGVLTVLVDTVLTFALPETWRIEVSGDTITVLRGGIEVDSLTDTDITTGSFGGLDGFRNGDAAGKRVIFDSFEVGSLGAAGVVNGTANVTLGGMSLTAAGKRVVHGTASVALGGMTVTGVGTVVGQTEGTATLDFGGITITAVGKRVVHGTATLTLGGITIHGTGPQAASINLTLTALTPVLAHGSAATPELSDHTALTPELAHGDIGHTLGHGQPGPPTT